MDKDLSLCAIISKIVRIYELNIQKYIMHGDVRQENLILDIRNFELFLTDFDGLRQCSGLDNSDSDGFYRALFFLLVNSVYIHYKFLESGSKETESETKQPALQHDLTDHWSEVYAWSKKYIMRMDQSPGRDCYKDSVFSSVNIPGMLDELDSKLPKICTAGVHRSSVVHLRTALTIIRNFEQRCSFVPNENNLITHPQIKKQRYLTMQVLQNL